jgi:RHS repeat-associated protein
VSGLEHSLGLSEFTGQLRYAVSLEVPAGRGGVKPQLAIEYAGGLGNGPLGVGWRIAVPGIERSLRKGVPGYTPGDELQARDLGATGRLVRLSDGSYRVQGSGESVRIAPHEAGFLATDAAGNRYQIGTTAAARIEDGARVASWHVERLSSATGESIEYRYRRDRGQVYLASVHWGPEQVFSVHFDYTARPDPTKAYRTGFAVTTALRLNAIRVVAFGELVRSYALTYDQQFALSRLHQITMHGRGGRGALPPLTFSYGAPAPTGLVEVNADGWGPGGRQTLADVDGDGVADLLQLEPGNVQWRRNLAGRFAPAQRLPGYQNVSYPEDMPVDLDGDAQLDLIGPNQDGWRRVQIEQGVLQPKSVWPGSDDVPSLSAHPAVLDLNGDGCVDVLSNTSDYGVLLAWFGSPEGLGELRRLQLSNRDVPRVQDGLLHDINGDDLVDIVFPTRDLIGLFLSRGDGTLESLRDAPNPWGNYGIDRSRLRVGDFNRDGLVDLASIGRGVVAWYPGKVDGSFGAVQEVWGPAEVTFAVIADVNGNGSVDFVWSWGARMWYVDLIGDPGTGLLRSVDNGLGQVTYIDYSSVAQLAAEDAAAGMPWTSQIPVAMPVVVATRTEVGDGSPVRTVRYRYRDGIWDRAEREFVGFAQSTVVVGAEGQRGARTVTSYLPGLADERVLRGLVSSQRIETADGTVVKASTTAWVTQPVAGLPDQPDLRVPIARSRTEQDFEGTSTPIETLVSYEHDGLGRVTHERSEGRRDRHGDEYHLELRYGAAGPEGVRDLVCESVVRDGADNIVARSRTYYGDSEATSPLCQNGRGWVRRRESHLQNEDRWIPVEQLEYDAFGNQVRRYADGVWSKRTFDAQQLYPEIEEVDAEQGVVLRSHIVWDRPAGQVQSITGPDGVRATARYDDFGRVVSIAHNDQPPHLRFTYDLRAPRPVSTKYIFDGPVEQLSPEEPVWSAEGRWRQETTVANAAGERLYSALRLGTERWLVAGTTERDHRGLEVAAFDSFAWTGAEVSAVPLPISGASPAPVQRTEYDDLGRVVGVELAGGGRQSVKYAAFTQTSQTSGLAAVKLDFDGQGRTWRSERLIDGRPEILQAEYDAVGRLTRVVLQAGAAEQRYGYDSLGRLHTTQDPDFGRRTFEYDDRGFVKARSNGEGQRIEYSHDGAGRLTAVTSARSGSFRYHHDVNRDGSPALGRLGWLEGPEDVVEFSYDAWGRPTGSRRALRGATFEQRQVLSASGLPLAVRHDDGFNYDLGYDAAGRLVRVGDWWQVTAFDPAGRVKTERYGNGLQQHYERDALGIPSNISVAAPGRTPLYHVGIERYPYQALKAVSDLDGAGLEHAAVYQYDGAARLRQVEMGGAAPLSLSYAYDALQNMTSRTASQPAAVDALLGTYRYAENGAGPRQLTSIVAPDGSMLRFAYDQAGRQVSAGAQRMGYNEYDELVSVEGLEPTGATGTVRFAYDIAGQRTLTERADGTIERWFTPDVVERGGVRTYYISAGAKVIARVDVPAQHRVGAQVLGNQLRGALFSLSLGLGLLSLALRRRRARGWLRRYLPQISCVLLGALLQAACTTGATGAGAQPRALTATTVTYFHYGPGAGPALLTGADGAVVEERRDEPFGARIGTTPRGAAPARHEIINGLNQPSDQDTGLSYHGNRWFEPRTARWLTADPLLMQPNPEMLASARDLHPYQYARQNPLLYWDPLGLDADPIEVPGETIEIEGTWSGELAAPGNELTGLEWVGHVGFMTVGTGRDTQYYLQRGRGFERVSQFDYMSTYHVNRQLRTPAQRHAVQRAVAMARTGTALAALAAGAGLAALGGGAVGTAVGPTMGTVVAELSALGASSRYVPELGRKLDYFLGRATGNAHNIQRSKQMLSQLGRIGLPDNMETREYLAAHLTRVLNDVSNVARVELNGRVVRESLLTGPKGVVKLETVWEGAKLITGNLFGGR